jgi:hypothetical protein
MSLRCFFGVHNPEGWATKPGVFGAGRCSRCHAAVGGVVIDRPAPRITQPVQKAKRRGVPTWLHGVFENNAAS